MTNLERVREELLDQEFALYDLDNTMKMLGYCSEADSGVFSQCLEDGNIVYSEIIDNIGVATIQLFFEILMPSESDLLSDYTIIRITKVEEF